MVSKTLNINHKNGVTYITFPKLEQTGAVRHLFSTRIGGVSTGQFSSMNTRFTGDDYDTVCENYRILCSTVGIDTKNLVLDVKGMEYISSAGLRVLLAAQKKMQKIGSMKVTGVCEDVMEVFEMTGFADILVIE